MTLRDMRDFLLKVARASFVVGAWAFMAGLATHSLVGLLMIGWRLAP